MTTHRELIDEQWKEITDLRARLAQLEADAAAMRAALEHAEALRLVDCYECGAENEAHQHASGLLSQPNPGRALLEAVEVAGKALEDAGRQLECSGYVHDHPGLDPAKQALAALAPWRKGES